MPNPLQGLTYEVIEDENNPTDWRAEAIDDAGEGECYCAVEEQEGGLIDVDVRSPSRSQTPGAICLTMPGCAPVEATKNASALRITNVPTIQNLSIQLRTNFRSGPAPHIDLTNLHRC